MKEQTLKDTDKRKVDIFESGLEVSLKGLLDFELRSLVGRTFFNRRPALNEYKNFLNLGCGPQLIEDKFWVNADFFRSRSKIVKCNFWGLDLRYPLKCQDAVWDGIFTEHTLEHLYPREVRALLKELYRTMKSGAIIRIIVPNLKHYLEFSSQQKENPAFEKFNSQCEAIRRLTQDYFHHSLWDADLLISELERVGFVNAKEANYREGVMDELLKDQESRKWESLYVEARKS